MKKEYDIIFEEQCVTVYRKGSGTEIGHVEFTSDFVEDALSLGSLILGHYRKEVLG